MMSLLLHKAQVESRPRVSAKSKRASILFTILLQHSYMDMQVLLSSQYTVAIGVLLLDIVHY